MLPAATPGPGMDEPRYPGAHDVAARLHAYFVRHIDAARSGGDPDLAPVPDVRSIEALVDVAFWASLRREEGQSPTISLVLLPSAQGGLSLTFEHPLPLRPDGLTRLAPAVARPGIHLGVWSAHDGGSPGTANGGAGGLAIWGATRVIPPFSLVVEVVAPGTLVVKHRRTTDGVKFVNVLVVEGDRVKVIDERGASTPDCPAVVASLLGFDPTDFWTRAHVLPELAISMRAHRHGGTLLVVPGETTAWRESVMQPVPYAVSPAFAGLTRLVKQDVQPDGRRDWNDAFGRLVEGIAGLTAVDGATLITHEYEVIGFGAKIVPRSHGASIDRVLLTEPIEGVPPVVVTPSQLGGTRHLSAAQFAWDQREALALVASQDGRFTVLGWSPAAGMVRAHRVETLLL
jgi:hypothetical protein